MTGRDNLDLVRGSVFDALREKTEASTDSFDRFNDAVSVLHDGKIGLILKDGSVYVVTVQRGRFEVAD